MRLVPERINDFITSKGGAPVCNRCIAVGLGLPPDTSYPAQITGALATTSDFTQEVGECSICTREKKVIRAAR